MSRNFILSVLLAAGLTANAQKSNVEVQTGAFTPDWESLSGWQCPEWFKDAKFGIWAHWGPQCHAEDGDWYARFMYYEGSGQYNWHVSHFGDPKTFGLKDLCNDWKAQKWDPAKLVNLYKSVGARYFMALGNHHDNFDLWDSPYQEWNSVNVGPKKDLIKGWSDACKEAGLHFGVSIHASHAWTWLEPSQDYDGNLTKEDGKGQWWEGLDPQELYAQNHPHSTGWSESGTIHSQWDWGNGASLPSEEYKQKFQNRVLELVNDYAPDMIYFDDTAMPFYGCDDQIGKNILTHYYNKAAVSDGTPQVVVTGKQLTKAQKDYMLWDVERGIPDRIQDEYWQTCTCIGSWHYDVNVYNSNGYKSAQQVVDMLVDIVSKNGNLLLSVPVRSDGTIDDKEEAILAGIKAWLDINGTSIYGTRPWKTFGEGPLADAANPLSAQGFNEGNNYSGKDVRYVQDKDGNLFATIMRWPAGKTFTFKSLGMSSQYYSGKVKSLQLLGHGDVNFTESIDGITVQLPDTRPNDIAPVFQITFVEGTDTPATLKEVVEGYEAKLKELTPSNNTGRFSKKGLNAFAEALEDARQHLGDSEANQQVVKNQLNEAYNTLLTTGRNLPGTPADGFEANLTTQHLVEASNFAAEPMGTRFGTPKSWTVENYSVSMTNGDKKNGIDAYPGHNTIMLGRWASEEVQPIESDLTNTRVYRTVHLTPGSYYFGQFLETSYNVPEPSYLFVANRVLTTQEVEDEAIAFANTNQAAVGKWFGLNFFIDKEQDVVLGWQADLTSGATEQEFRVKEVKLLGYGTVNNDALFNLIERSWYTLDMAKINGNTGYYRRDAANVLEAAIGKAEEISDKATKDEIDAAYETLQQALDDFLNNGKNVGSAPIGSSYEDITVKTLKEAQDFARTDETQSSGRFGATKYWTVENFGFDDQAGIDNNPGYDCLHLEVWWNNNAFADNGYDIGNARLYQQAELPAGRYYFGAAYSPFEPNDVSYIFASDQILDSKDIPTQSIAYEQVSLAPRDGNFRGIYFTLEETKTVYLGFQADFSNSNTNNVRVKAVKLLYYGEISHSKLQALITSVEEQVAGVFVNENTGYYSQQAFDKLSAVISAAKAVAADADYDTVSEAYNSLSEALTDFLQNGRNGGGEPEKLNATDLTEEKLVEASGFSRDDESITSRFAKPKYWTVENFSIPNGGDGTKQGLDKYPGYDCLMLGLWDDRDRNEEGDLSDARIYRKVHLEAGRYYFGNTFNTRYNLGQAYLFAAAEPLATNQIETASIAWRNFSTGGDDTKFDGIYFTLTEPQDVYLGFQANLADGNGQQEFRADKVVLYGYNIASGVEMVNVEGNETSAVEYYTLTGLRLQKAPQRGFYIVRQGSSARIVSAK